MKKLLTFYFLLFLLNGLFAQTYIPIPENNAAWKSTGFNERLCSHNEYKTVGDTMINSKKYIMIKSTQLLGTLYGTVCTRGTAFFTKTQLIRNDSANKKVYLYNSNTEVLLYDFDLQLGDTLPNTYLYDSSLNLLTVDSIYTDTFVGIPRKVYYSETFIHLPYLLIEGIGSNRGLLDHVVFSIDVGSSLDCFLENRSVLYPDTTSPCMLVTGLDQSFAKQEPTFKIYPNPAEEAVNIKWQSTATAESIRLYDLFGREQKVKRIRENNQSYRLLLESLPAGIYLLRIAFEDGREVSRKVLVE